MVQVESPHTDVTDALLDYADSYTRRIGPFWPLTAYIFKARSPSCGIGSTPVNPGEPHERRGDGLFAQRFRTWAPWLSLYEEEDLQTEDACLELIFLSFICRDIIWNSRQASVKAKALHWANRLDIQALSDCGDVESLWLAVKQDWQQRQQEERRDTIQSFRIA